MSFCPKCNKEYPDNLSSCPYCASEGDNADSDNVQTQEIDQQSNENITNNEADGFFGETPQKPENNPYDKDTKLSKGALIGVIIAALAVVAIIVVVIVLIFGNSNNNAQNKDEDLTMPSGYEEIIQNIKDDDGNLITEATDPYGNTVTREVDDNGNVTTTFIGPDGEVSTVTTDSDGNIISYDTPSSSNNNASSKNNSSKNTSSKNNSSNNSSKTNSSSSANTSSSSSSNNNSNNSSNNNSSSDTNNNNSDGSVTINGKKYNVGDTVTLKVTAGEIMEPVAGYQFRVAYDENLLELDKKSVVYHDNSCIANLDLQGEILMSSISVMQGFDFGSMVPAFECQFKVKDSTTKSCDIVFEAQEVYTGVGANDLVDVTDQLQIDVTVE